MTEVPVVYGRRGPVAGLSAYGRLVASAVALSCLAVLGTAAWLKPNPSGCGTHKGLSMAPCAFLSRTGLPCPACGMTTSFSWFVRGNWVASVYVQPMGFVLAVLTAMAAWAGGYVAVTGRPVWRLLQTYPDSYYLGPMLVLVIVAWGWKMFIHLHGVDGWR